MNQLNNTSSSLPHHRLLVYRKSLELLAAARAAQVRNRAIYVSWTTPSSRRHHTIVPSTTPSSKINDPIVRQGTPSSKINESIVRQRTPSSKIDESIVGFSTASSQRHIEIGIFRTPTRIFHGWVVEI